ncbi:hypothetical protein GGI04_000217 [Coemansia thaxteri]|nr:hypothetical protein GGI04_000217 [Coemansia thaxteri]KAJ2474207.1 hypothetical protein GGI02_000252 [Coemansia sp. RSA 2322]
MVRVLTSLGAIVVGGVGLVAGNLTGSGVITYHDYQAIPAELVVNNPPSCGMPYAQLDLTRITAVQAMNTATDCGQCIKVSNANDPSKFVYVLAVDTGGRGLDLSKPSFGKLFNIDDGVGPANWAPVSNSNCVGIWSNAPPTAQPPVVQPPVVQPPVVQPPVVQPPPPVISTPVAPTPVSSPPVVAPKPTSSTYIPPPPPPPPPVIPRSTSAAAPQTLQIRTSSSAPSSSAGGIPNPAPGPSSSAAPLSSTANSSSNGASEQAGLGSDVNYPDGIGHNGEMNSSSNGDGSQSTGDSLQSSASSTSSKQPDSKTSAAGRLSLSFVLSVGALLGTAVFAHL